MKLVRTIKLRLQEDPQVFQSTIDSYTKAFNYTCQVGWNDKDYNGVSLHKKVYKKPENIFLLNSPSLPE